jgi:hypothetical protein
MRAKFALVAILCSPLIWSSVLAQEPQDTSEAGSQTAITTSDPEIPVGHLDLLLDPLTRNELLVEAKGWRDLVKAKVQEISAEEIATRDKTREIDEAQAEPSAAAPEATEQQEQQKKKILDTLTTAREERAALLERLKTVLNAYELKGGDPKEFRQYAAAVSGIKVEVTDTNAHVVGDQGVDYFKGRRPQMGHPATSVHGHHDRFRDPSLDSRGGRSQGHVG